MKVRFLCAAMFSATALMTHQVTSAVLNSPQSAWMRGTGYEMFYLSYSTAFIALLALGAAGAAIAAVAAGVHQRVRA